MTTTNLELDRDHELKEWTIDEDVAFSVLTKLHLREDLDQHDLPNVITIVLPIHKS